MMNQAELLTRLRMEFVLIEITLATAGPKDTSVVLETRKKLASLQRSVLDQVAERSIKWGTKYAVPNILLPSVVQSAGKALAEMKGLLASLSDEQKAGFAVVMVYEPVPDPQAFSALPAPLFQALGGAVDRRALACYDEGIENAIQVLLHKASFLLTRLADYHEWAHKKEGTKVIFREVVWNDFRQAVDTLNAANIEGRETVKRFLGYVDNTAHLTIDTLREDAGARFKLISAVQPLRDALVNYLGGNTQNEDATQDGE